MIASAYVNVGERELESAHVLVLMLAHVLVRPPTVRLSYERRRMLQGSTHTVLDVGTYSGSDKHKVASRNDAAGCTEKATRSRTPI